MDQWKYGIYLFTFKWLYIYTLMYKFHSCNFHLAMPINHDTILKSSNWVKHRRKEHVLDTVSVTWDPFYIISTESMLGNRGKM